MGRLAVILGVCALVACRGDEAAPVFLDEDPALPGPEPEPEPVDPGVLVVDLDPPLDWARSPYTGWTRAHHVALFARMTRGYAAHLSAGRARTEFAGDPMRPQQLEGVTRMLTAFGAWLADPGNPDVIEVEGERLDIRGLAVDAIVNGTDPDQPDEYWRPIGDGQHQAKVEAAFVAAFLVDSRARVWDTLEPAEQAHILEWLAPADGQHGNNFLVLLATRELARGLLGASSDTGRLDELLDAMEAHHVGDGWYRDGEAGLELDWYNGFVIHPELLRWVVLDGARDPARMDRIITRARAFLDHLPYFFDSDGAAVVFGRSLSYRAAFLAPALLATRAGVSPLTPGLTRRLVSGALRFHVGALTADDRMLDGDDVVRRGYIASEPEALEEYIDPSSQYMVARAFAGLALPAGHPLWADREAPAPADLGPFVRTLAAPGFTLACDGPGEHVRMASTRAWKSVGGGWIPHYGKLAYSSRLYFDTGQDAPGDPVPSDSSVSLDAGSGPLARGPALAGLVAPGVAYVGHGLPDDSRVARTITLAIPGGEVRVGCIDGAAPGDLLVAGGFPVADAAAVTSGADWTHLATADASVLLRDLLGDGSVELDRRTPNLIHEAAVHLAVHRVVDELPACVAILQVARRRGFAGEAAADAVVTVSPGADPQTFDLELASGARAWLSLEADPPARELAFGPLRFSGPLRVALVDAAGEAWVAGPLLTVHDEAATPVATFAEPGLLELHREPGSVRVSSDRPLVLRVPSGDGPLHIHGSALGGAWVDNSAHVAVDGDQADIDAALWAEHTSALDLTRASFRVERTDD